MIAVLKIVGERSMTKSYCPVSLLFVVNEGLEKVVNNWPVNHFEEFRVFF